MSAKMLRRSSKSLVSFSLVPLKTQLVFSSLTYTGAFFTSSPIKNALHRWNFFTNQMNPVAPKSVPSIRELSYLVVTDDWLNLNSSF